MKLYIRLLFSVCIVIVSFLMWVHAEKKPQTKIKQIQHKEETKQEEQKQPQMVHIKRKDGTQLTLELETYLIGVVGSEMSADFELEALKAQAVAARTFAAQRNFQVDDTTSSQVYQDDEQLKVVWGNNYASYRKKIKQAVDETKGNVLTYQDTYITAAFFSSSCGHTNNSEDYWKNASPYLRSVESPWDLEIDGNKQEVSWFIQDFSTQLGFQTNVTSISQPVLYDSGYVKTITIDGIVFTGREIREKLQLRSSAFTIKKEGNQMIITTYGFGHGIGMSQYGANAMAKQGKTWEEIVRHYYQNVEITTLDV